MQSVNNTATLSRQHIKTTRERHRLSLAALEWGMSRISELIDRADYYNQAWLSMNDSQIDKSDSEQDKENGVHND